MTTSLGPASQRFMSGSVRGAGLMARKDPGPWGRLTRVSPAPIMPCLAFEGDVHEDGAFRPRWRASDATLTISSQINRWPEGEGPGTGTPPAPGCLEPSSLFR